LHDGGRDEDRRRNSKRRKCGILESRRVAGQACRDSRASGKRTSRGNSNPAVLPMAVFHAFIDWAGLVGVDAVRNRNLRKGRSFRIPFERFGVAEWIGSLLVFAFILISVGGLL